MNEAKPTESRENNKEILETREGDKEIIQQKFYKKDTESCRKGRNQKENRKNQKDNI